MNKLERQSIEDSLSNILARMEPQALEAISQWTDPLVLVMGLISWGTRVARIMQERDLAEAEAMPEPEPAEPAAAAAPRNGQRPGSPGFVPSPEDFQRALGGA